MPVVYKRDLEDVNWAEMKAILKADGFDNGRTPAQLEASFSNSTSTCIAYDGDRMVGTTRLLSDGVCNAYVLDLWTHSPLRRRGIGRTMMETLMAELPGQHVYLSSQEDTVEFYRALGFEEQWFGLGRVIGRWLDNRSEFDAG